MIQRTLRATCIFLLASLLGSVALMAQDSEKPFHSPNFPVPFGPDNLGTEFFLAFPANWEFNTANKYVRFYISSGVETKVDIYALGQFKGSITTVPNDIVTFDLSNLEGQVFVRNDQAPLPDDQVYPGKAVRIVAQDPIILYGMNRTDFTSDGFLALPTNALGKEYVVASAASVAGGVQELPSQYMIVAPYDNTIVTVVNPMDTPNNREGIATTFNMNKGDVYSAMSVGFSGDLSGARIQASKPVSVIAGQNCTYLPTFEFPACDHIVEMLTPLESWGTFYHSIPFQERTKGDTYRIFAGEPGAEIYVNGTQIATLSRVGGGVGLGWIEYRPDERMPMEIHSNKRIFVAQYNNSQSYDNSTSTDPFYMILTPVEQFQTDLIFATPGADFPKNFVNIVCDSAGMFEIEITEAGKDEWEKLLVQYNGSFQSFYTQIGGKNYVGKSFPIQPGTYQLRGPQPFAGYIYGGGQYDSYGYPLSVATANIRAMDVVAPPIVGEPDCDGFVSGSVRDLPDDQNVRTNLSTIRLLQGSSNYELTVEPFDAGISRSTTFELKVIDPKVDGIAILGVSDMAGNTSFDTVYFYARSLEFTPNPLDFGQVLINDPIEKDVTVHNTGNRKIDLKELMLQKGTTGFEILDPTGALSLEPDEKRTIKIRFVAGEEGAFADSLGFRDDCGSAWVVLLKGQTAVPVIDVSDLDFGQQPVGQFNRMTMQILNKGTGVLKVTAVDQQLTQAVFTLPNGEPAFPLNLNAGSSQSLVVQFLPTAEQQYLDSITFVHNAPDNPDNDPVGIVKGEGILAFVLGTPYDWGKRRVNTGPYTATVYIKNDGTADAKIFGTLRLDGDVRDFEILNLPDIANVTVPSGDQIPVEVAFKPTALGPRQLVIYYRRDDVTDETVFSRLTGIGVVPGLGTDSLDFGAMILGTAEKTLDIDFQLIRNYPDNIVGDYRDTVWIDGFQFVSDQDGGTDDFRYDDPAGGFPIVLIPGEREVVTISGYFDAQINGVRTGELRALTRDGVDTTSYWIGRGIAQDAGITASATAAQVTCVGEGDMIVLTIESNGDVPLSVMELLLDDPNGEFTWDGGAAPNVPFSIPPGQSRTFNIQFTPSQSGQRSATVTIKSSDPETPSLDIAILGEGAQFDVPAQMLLIGTNPLDQLAVLGEKMLAQIVVTAPLDPINATGYTLILRYDPEDLVPPSDESEIILNPQINPAGSQVTINPASTPGEMIIDVTNPSPLTGTGNLVAVPFGVAFNTNLERQVEVEFSFDGAMCTTIDVADATLGVNPICGLNLRMIELVAGEKYALHGATPNPVNNIMGEVQYSLGLDGPTRVTIYDAAGTLVGTLVDQYQQPGSYSVSFDATNFASGLYYCVLESGHYTETKSMTIAK